MQADRAAILHILSDSSDWVEASRLADALGVTTRTIRNRVKKINEDGARSSSSPPTEATAWPTARKQDLSLLQKRLQKGSCPLTEGQISYCAGSSPPTSL